MTTTATTLDGIVDDMKSLEAEATGLAAELSPRIAAGDRNAIEQAADLLDRHDELVDRLVDLLVAAFGVHEKDRDELANGIRFALANRGVYDWMYDHGDQVHDVLLARAE